MNQGENCVFCKYYGSEIKEDQTDCPKCGRSINEEVMAENEEERIVS